jgi:hypothetical protein
MRKVYRAVRRRLQVVDASMIQIKSRIGPVDGIEHRQVASAEAALSGMLHSSPHDTLRVPTTMLDIGKTDEDNQRRDHRRQYAHADRG